MDPVVAEIEKERIEGNQTRSLLVKDYSSVTITPDECKKLCSKIGLKYEQGYENRIIQYKFTDATVDRYGDKIIAKGVKLDKYKANPIVLAFHNSFQLPVGMCVKVWYDKESDSVKGWVLFLDSRADDTGVSDSIYKMAASGALKTGSIGFLPVAGKVRRPTDAEKKDFGMGDYGAIYEEVELVEFSIVPLPANPAAMQEPITKGFFSRKAIEKLRDEKAFDEKDMIEIMSMFEKAAKSFEAANTGVKKKMETEIKLTIPVLDDAAMKQIEDLENKGFKVVVTLGEVKSATTGMDMEALAELITIKSGAVLSKKNKSLVNGAIDSLQKSITALQELIKAGSNNGDAEDAADGGADDDEEDSNGKKKPKKNAPNAPNGGTSEKSVYGKNFLDMLDKGSKSISEAATTGAN